MAVQREQFDASQEQSIRNLGREALWLVLHSLFAIFLLALILGVMTIFRPDPGWASPRVFTTALAFLVPLIGGFSVVRMQRDPQRARVARYAWISGMLLFAMVCVWVLDLPTGPGLCATCGPVEKLTRTFFSISNGSGLMGEEGLLVGTWVPLSMIGYAAGAAIGLKS